MKLDIKSLIFGIAIGICVFELIPIIKAEDQLTEGKRFQVLHCEVVIDPTTND